MLRPRVVVDTNILILSLWSGPLWHVVRAWRDGTMWLLISEDILREYLRVLARFVTTADLKTWVELFVDPTRSIWVTPREAISIIQDDPSDNRFLECALAGAAEAIVSGDRHLLSVGAFREIPILTPVQFLKRFPLR